MEKLPKKLKDKLEARAANHALRKLPKKEAMVDFSSNDYLGLAGNEEVAAMTTDFLKGISPINGATGSRLLSGNHELYHQLENLIVDHHKSEAALVFNSGYDANVGFFSSVPQRGDIVLYDELVHASIRDGIQMSHTKAYKFAHNDLDDLFKIIERNRNKEEKGDIYVVTESVFSMDGDSPDLKSMAALCREFSCYLVVDEAHATGIFGSGRDKVSELGLEEQVFARLITFGKAIGCHGAAILGSESLKQYLINFARSFIYTTALPPHTIASIFGSYSYLQKNNNGLSDQLFENIDFFKQETQRLQISEHFVVSDSAIQCAIIPGNAHVKAIANQLKYAGFDVKPILSPTVNEGMERLRFCLHVFNKKEDITQVLSLLKKNLESGL